MRISTVTAPLWLETTAQRRGFEIEAVERRLALLTSETRDEHPRLPRHAATLTFAVALAAAAFLVWSEVPPMVPVQLVSPSDSLPGAHHADDPFASSTGAAMAAPIRRTPA